MRWSNKLIESIVRGYLIAPELETNTTTYIPSLHHYVTKENPEIVSEQRIADLRRVIINNKMITEQQMKRIRDELVQQLYVQNYPNLNPN